MRTEAPTFLPEDYETVGFPEPIGRMEAFVAGPDHAVALRKRGFSLTVSWP